MKGTENVEGKQLWKLYGFLPPCNWRDRQIGVVNKWPTFQQTQTDRQDRGEGFPPPNIFFWLSHKAAAGARSAPRLLCGARGRSVSCQRWEPARITSVLSCTELQCSVLMAGWARDLLFVCLLGFLLCFFLSLSSPPLFFPLLFPPFLLFYLISFFFSVINLIIFGTDSACGRGKRVCNHISCGCCIASWWAEGYHDV